MYQARLRRSNTNVAQACHNKIAPEPAFHPCQPLDIVEARQSESHKIDRELSKLGARYMSITGKLRADVEKIGASIEGVGAHRAIALRLIDDSKVWAYPIVGIPTAEVLNDIADKARRSDQLGVPVLVYDHIGIRETWSAHLKWLDEQIRAVRTIKVSEAGWSFAAWEAES